MTLEPIHIDEDNSKSIYQNPFCQEIFKSYPDYYFKVGYNPPWIGYFVMDGGTGFMWENPSNSTEPSDTYRKRSCRIGDKQGIDFLLGKPVLF